MSLLKVENVMSVYSGKANKCCCGCAGKHSYNPDYRVEAGLDRGYAVDNDELNPTMIRKVVGLMWENADQVLPEADHLVLQLGERVYIAYLVKHA